MRSSELPQPETTREIISEHVFYFVLLIIMFVTLYRHFPSNVSTDFLYTLGFFTVMSTALIGLSCAKSFALRSAAILIIHQIDIINDKEDDSDPFPE